MPATRTSRRCRPSGCRRLGWPIDSSTPIRFAVETDWPGIEKLLVDSELPLVGAREHLQTFLVVESAGAVIGCGALEIYGSTALLRSVAVDPSRRSQRIGEQLIRKLITLARTRRVGAMVLLTTTAAHWFPRFGFRETTRESVPPEVKESLEFRDACPATAVVMRMDLNADYQRR